MKPPDAKEKAARQNVGDLINTDSDGSGNSDDTRHRHLAQRFVVNVRATQANGRPKIKIWSTYNTAIEAEQVAAKLRSYGWDSWAEVER